MKARGFAQRPAAQASSRGSRRRARIAALVIIAASLELIGAAARAADLTSAVIRGSSVYDAPELFEVYRDQLGKPISQSGARAIVAELIAKYERDGYSRPQVRVDDALIQHGILRIDVSEARISEVKISGDPGPHLARLETLGSQLRGDGPIRQEDMQATLKRMRELPGLTLSASTARDDALANAYRLDLDTLFDPLSGAVRLSNRGTEEAGPNFILGQVVANGLLGGQTSLGGLFGAATDYDEYHGAGALANVGFGELGARVATSAFRSRSDPHEAVVDRGDLYVRDRVTARMTRPLAALSDWGASVFVGLKLEDLEISRSGQRLRDERLRMIETGTGWNWRGGSASQYVGSLELVKGLDALGSGLAALDLANDPRRADFTLLRMNLVRATRLNERWSIRLDAFAQQSAYVLPYSERFKIGGDRLGRGFEVAEIAGDQGIGAKVEARRRLTDAPALLGRASIYGFYDGGATWKQDVPGRESAATAGIGFATQRRRTTGSLELAQPLTHADVEGSRRLTLFAELAVTF
jgi:hemolysin activation/secretion protein